ncbi:hypothetical protein P5V90_06810 [Mycobacteroides abscessus subsp. abscessus]|nr:hypothetical protein [Mycobacteroides abscessus]MDO3166666.1 hypothetical protein [Mycobacteroides abscessus subsp. abscessus]
MSVDAVVLAVECLSEPVGKKVGGESHWIDQWAAKSGLCSVTFGLERFR